jgi:hypothetical protein
VVPDNAQHPIELLPGSVISLSFGIFREGQDAASSRRQFGVGNCLNRIICPFAGGLENCAVRRFCARRLPRFQTNLNADRDAGARLRDGCQFHANTTRVERLLSCQTALIGAKVIV